MSSHDAGLDEFEKRARAVLEQSVSRIDGRTRSRLNLARHAALARLERPSRIPLWRSFALAPAGVVAAVLLAVALWGAHRLPTHAASESPQSAVEDLDLVADGDTLDLIQDDGGFYEWAVAQADAAPEETG